MLTPFVRDRLAALAVARLGLAIAPVYENRLTQALAGASHALGAETDEATLADLEALPDEADAWQRVIQCLTIGETCFLRQRDWFARIETDVLAPLIQARRAAGQRRLRVWSAGCATGEEAYSIAILIDRLLPDRDAWDARVLGSDINAAALAVADEAVYRPWALRETDPATQARCFVEVGPDRFRVAPAIRRLVSFRTLNLARGIYPDLQAGIGGFDLLLCRNVMIYLSPDRQDEVAARLTQCLAEDGWLIVSPTEAVAARFRPLTLVSFPNAIFFRASAGPTPPRPQPAAASPAAPRPPRQVRNASERQGEPAPPARAGRPLPAPPPDAMARARTLADGGRLAEALQRCQAALAQDAMSAEANLLLATICAEMGDDGATLDAARRAAYLLPESAAAHFLMGAALSRLGKATQSRRSMAAVVRLLDTQPADAPVGLGAEATVGTLRAAASAYLARAEVPLPGRGW